MTPRPTPAALDHSPGAAASTAVVAAAGAHGLIFRGLRFGSPTAGTTGSVTVTYLKADGTQEGPVVEGVTAGEVWSISSTAIYAITAISGVTVRALS